MTDLQQLIDDLNNEPQVSYSSFVNETFYRSEVVNLIAMNILLSLGSTYYHNYFMFHDPNSTKWSMLPWDMDKTLSYYGSGFPYQRSSTIWVPDNPYHEKAIHDDQLLAEIRQRIVSLDASIFNLNYITPIIDSIQSVITASVAEDQTDDVSDVNLWQTKVNAYKNTFANRKANVLVQVDQYPRNFTVERIGSAEPNTAVTLHWTPSNSPLQRPISYRFLFGDEPGIDNNTASILIENVTDTFVQFTTPTMEGAYFYKMQAYDGFTFINGFDTYNPIFVTSNVPELVINEINYNSSAEFGTADWVEIYNPLPYSVNMEGWQIKDNRMTTVTLLARARR
ncbi:MAG: CotH kinase family protein [Flavobacteriales bacterium]|nr:CotH kinase family protein [Flavobacteriales bacterium]